ncbi:PH domain-containing protein [Chloroflexota bacterium]
MNYSRSVLLYQDEPSYGLFLKLIVVLVPAALLVASIYLLSSGESSGGLALLVEAFIVGFIFWIVFPRRYQVYEDHIRIALGGPFSVKVGFDKIEAIRVTSKFIFSVNFVTKMTKIYVEIAKKRGMSIAITPRDNDLFIENANRALTQWVKTSAAYRGS